MSDFEEGKFNNKGIWHKECGRSGYGTKLKNFSAPFNMHFDDKAKAMRRQRSMREVARLIVGRGSTKGDSESHFTSLHQ